MRRRTVTLSDQGCQIGTIQLQHIGRQELLCNENRVWRKRPKLVRWRFAEGSDVPQNPTAHVADVSAALPHVFLFQSLHHRHQLPDFFHNRLLDLNQILAHSLLALIPKPVIFEHNQVHVQQGTLRGFCVTCELLLSIFQLGDHCRQGTVEPVDLSLHIILCYGLVRVGQFTVRRQVDQSHPFHHSRGKPPALQCCARISGKGAQLAYLQLPRCNRLPQLPCLCRGSIHQISIHYQDNCFDNGVGACNGKRCRGVPGKLMNTSQKRQHHGHSICQSLVIPPCRQTHRKNIEKRELNFCPCDEVDP